MKLITFRATHRPSSGAKNCTGSFRFFIRGRMFGRVVGGRCQDVPDNVHLLETRIIRKYVMKQENENIQRTIKDVATITTSV